MKFVIAGAGAIGAYVGAKMAQKGQEVILFARGPHFRAMKENGVRVQSAEEDFVVRPAVVDDLTRAGTADFVFLGVKAHSLTDLAPKLGTLIGPQTTFVSTQNGIPWWYFQKLEGDLAGTQLERIDPGGPVTGDEHAPDIQPLERSWHAAVHSFAHSGFAFSALGRDFRQLYAACKRQELQEFAVRVTDVEYDAYLRTT